MFKTFKKIMKDNKGLTLIELLAVIVIIGIIGGIAVSAFTGQGEQARITAHESNIANIASSAERYDLERGLRTNDFTVLTSTHPIIDEGYMNDEVENPWEDVNVDFTDYEYIVTKDNRDIVYVYLAEAGVADVSDMSIVVIENDEGTSTGTHGLQFTDDAGVVDTREHRFYTN